MHSLINWIYMAKYLENNYDHYFYHIQNKFFSAAPGFISCYHCEYVNHESECNYTEICSMEGDVS